VTVDGELVGAIGPGLLILLGVAAGDGEQDSAWLLRKIVRMRLFPDDDGRFDRSLLDTGGEALVVSQFTLLAATRKGTRPDFGGAAPPAEAEQRYQDFCTALGAELGRAPATGRFGAMMDVALVNDGPVTIVLDSRQR